MSNEATSGKAAKQTAAPAKEPAPFAKPAGLSSLSRRAVHGPESREPGPPLSAIERACERLREIVRLPRSAAPSEILNEAADRMEQLLSKQVTTFDGETD